MTYWIFLSLIVVAVAVALVLPHYRLQKAMQAPFPDEWVAIVERNIAVYKNLPTPLRLQLRKLIKQFLHQKHFSGAGGLEITEEIRVTIAAEACMLLVNRETRVYPLLRYIIVYPTAFVVDRPQGGADGIVSEGRKGLLHRGYAIEELASQSDFLEVAYLLLYGELILQALPEKMLRVVRFSAFSQHFLVHLTD